MYAGAAGAVVAELWRGTPAQCGALGVGLIPRAICMCSVFTGIQVV